MGANIFTAAVPEPYRILGLKLKPFSIGRYQRLKRFNCAFVADEEVGANMDDLLTAVLICSMRCREFDALIDNDVKFAKELKRWKKHILREVKGTEFNILDKFNLFKNYIAEAQKIPSFWNEFDDNEPSGSHWTHGMEVVLRSELGWTQEEIEERPFAKAIMDWLKWTENQGGIRIMTDEEIACGDANARAFEELMKEGGLCQASN